MFLLLFRFNGKQATNAKYKYKITEQLEELERDEGLAMLMPDIQHTANLVCDVTDRLIINEHDGSQEGSLNKSIATSNEERYLQTMRALQFGKALSRI